MEEDLRDGGVHWRWSGVEWWSAVNGSVDDWMIGDWPGEGRMRPASERSPAHGR